MRISINEQHAYPDASNEEINTEYDMQWQEEMEEYIEEVTQEEVSEYLDDIRESGLINMLEAVTHIMGVFDISKDDAKSYWMHWATHFGEDDAEG